jgi:hypothetical protein
MVRPPNRVIPTGTDHRKAMVRAVEAPGVIKGWPTFTFFVKVGRRHWRSRMENRDAGRMSSHLCQNRKGRPAPNRAALLKVLLTIFVWQRIDKVFDALITMFRNQNDVILKHDPLLTCTLLHP